MSEEKEELIWKYNTRAVSIKIRRLPEGYRVKHVDIGTGEVVKVDE